MLADILPTSYEVGVLNGRVAPGDTVAIVGAGPIGLSAIVGARLFSPEPRRRDRPRRRAARRREAVRRGRHRQQRPPGRGRDRPGAHRRARRRRRHRGGRRPGDLRALRRSSSARAATSPTSASTASRRRCTSRTLWIKDVTITTGLVDTYSTPTLLRLVATRQLDASMFATHHFKLFEMEKAYDIFSRAAETGALKVVLSR